MTIKCQDTENCQLLRKMYQFELNLEIQMFFLSILKRINSYLLQLSPLPSPPNYSSKTLKQLEVLTLEKVITFIMFIGAGTHLINSNKLK